jgi:hypothetical protein
LRYSDVFAATGRLDPLTARVPPNSAGESRWRPEVAGGGRNELSRILAGFHFRKAFEEGIEHGRKIGNLAVDRFLRPASG